MGWAPHDLSSDKQTVTCSFHKVEVTTCTGRCFRGFGMAQQKNSKRLSPSRASSQQEDHEDHLVMVSFSDENQAADGWTRYKDI